MYRELLVRCVWYKMTISAIENVAADFMRPGHRVIWRSADHNGKYFCHPHKKYFMIPV